MMTPQLDSLDFHLQSLPLCLMKYLTESVSYTNLMMMVLRFET